MQVGDVVSFDLPAAAMKDHATADSDQVFSGRYLVTACRHKIDRDRHACVLELVKDSIVKAFVSPATTNASFAKTSIDCTLDPARIEIETASHADATLAGREGLIAMA